MQKSKIQTETCIFMLYLKYHISNMKGLFYYFSIYVMYILTLYVNSYNIYKNDVFGQLQFFFMDMLE